MGKAQIAKMSQPRGPVFDPVVRANFQTCRRVRKDLPIKTGQIDGQVALGLGDKLGPNGVPSDRRVRSWIQEMPDYPERMIQAGIINESDIRSQLRPYLS